MKVVRLDDCIDEIKSLDNCGVITRSTNHICEDMRKEVKEFEAVPIPEGATNGDVIKTIYPDCKDWKARIEDNDGEVYEVHFVELPNSIPVNKYDESWWNAPYKAESEDKVCKDCYYNDGEVHAECVVCDKG